MTHLDGYLFVESVGWGRNFVKKKSEYLVNQYFVVSAKFKLLPVKKRLEKGHFCLKRCQCKKINKKFGVVLLNSGQIFPNFVHNSCTKYHSKRRKTEAQVSRAPPWRYLTQSKHQKVIWIPSN